MVPALRASAGIAEKWMPRLISNDRSKLVFAAASLTERQGGSDVRSNKTTAHPVGDDIYSLNGLKWFITCPWADILLVLAQAPGGLTCFMVESSSPGFRIERLKDKLGWHSLGVGEVEFKDVPGQRLGEEGRGVGVIMRMIAYTRLDVMLESAASLRKGALYAVHQARHRHVLGRKLVDQPASQCKASSLYCALELNLRIKPRRRLKRDKPDALSVPVGPNLTWSMDFMATGSAMGARSGC